MRKLFPPDHPLGSASLKLKRANVHYYGLVRRMRGYIAASGPEVIFRPKGEVKTSDEVMGMKVAKPMVYELSIDPRLKDVWGLVIGDVIHNLRHALDHVAWALATEHERVSGVHMTPEDAASVYFPLRADRLAKDVYVGGLNWNDVRLFPPSAYNTIEKFQPYNRDKWPELRFLYVLHKLCNLDKHRVVTPVFSDVSLTIGGSNSLGSIRLNKPSQIMYMVTPNTARALGGKVEPEASYEVDIGTGLPYPDDFMNIYGLRLMHHFIRDEVVPSFARFF